MLVQSVRGQCVRSIQAALPPARSTLATIKGLPDSDPRRFRALAHSFMFGSILSWPPSRASSRDGSSFAHPEKGAARQQVHTQSFMVAERRFGPVLL
eukprot:3298042-Alexandrium_andersonii.AAC.1